jgi:hypothetical protein
LRKYVVVFLAIISFCVCAPKQQKIDRIIEGGVEVILNHKEPYKVPGEKSSFSTEKLFSIDTEEEKKLAINLVDIENFDVDDEGNIFLIQWQSKENYIYSFDKDGNFIKSFCRKGQGPGELEWGGAVYVTPQNEIYAKDPSETKYLLFEKSGDYIKDVALPKHISLLPLKNNKYLVDWQDHLPDHFVNHVGIASFNAKDLKELSSFRWANPMTGRIEVNGSRMFFTASNDFVFIGHAGNDYEIHAYNLDGKLQRKIRKDFSPIDVSEKYKREYFERFKPNDPIRKNYYFTKSWPSYRNIFADDVGRLYVMTYEDGDEKDSFIYDIFNPEGIFIGRMSLSNMENNRPTKALIKNNILYYIHIKESGYKELVVSKVIWN